MTEQSVSPFSPHESAKQALLPSDADPHHAGVLEAALPLVTSYSLDPLVTKLLTWLLLGVCVPQDAALQEALGNDGDDLLTHGSNQLDDFDWEQYWRNKMANQKLTQKRKKGGLGGGESGGGGGR